MRPDGAEPAPRRADPADAQPVLTITRIGIGILLALAIANAGFLFFFPSQAEEHYAWPIVPAVSAAFIGAGYMAGVLATGLAVSSRSWAPVRPFVPALGLLGLILFVVTLIHADRFRWDYPPTWVWTAVYAAIPPGSAYLWHRQRGAHADRARGAAGGALRVLGFGLGFVSLAIGALLLIAPDDLLEAWPWPLTPLMSQVFAAWYALAGCALIGGAAWMARPADNTVVFATTLLWALLTLALPLLYGDQVDTGSDAYAPWIGYTVALALGSAWGLARALADRPGAGPEA